MLSLDRITSLNCSIFNFGWFSFIELEQPY